MDYEKLDDKFGFLLHDVTNLMIKSMEKKIAHMNMTRSQWEVLVHINRIPGIKQNQLAHILDVKPMSLTRMIDRLEKKNWVIRENDVNDKRINRIYVTDEVLPIVQEIYDLGVEHVYSAFNLISPKDQETMIRCLKIMRKHFESKLAI